MKKMKAILISVLFSTLLSLLLLSAAAFVVSKTALPQDGMLQVITTLLCCCCILAGGYAASLFIREKGILCGLLTAGIFIVLLAAVSAILQMTPFVTAAGMLKICAILISGMLGGILGANRREKVKF